MEVYYYVVDTTENKFIFVNEKDKYFFICSTDEFIKKPEDMQPIINKLSDMSKHAITSFVVHSADVESISAIVQSKNLIIRVVKPIGDRDWEIIK